MAKGAKAEGRGRRKPARLGAIDTSAIMPAIYRWNPFLAPLKRITLRARLERYLHLGPVYRTPEGLNDRMAIMDQAFVDILLRRVLDGQDPRTVFAVGATRRGRKSDEFREMAAAYEVARLLAAGAADVATAAEAVAEAFGDAQGWPDTRTVQRWWAKYRKHITQTELDFYMQEIKAAKLL